MPSEEIDGVVISSFPNASTIENNDVVTGLHNGNNANFLFSGIAAYIRQGLSNIFVPWSRIGTPNGAASLDSTGKVPSSQLPSIPSDASDIIYDPTTSGLSATNVQDAVDEVQSEIDNLPSPPVPSDANPQDLGTAAAGSSADYSRADHVHNKPTAADIGAQDEITAAGILKGDGAGGVSAAVAGTDYQAPLTIDATPTASSTNPVKSGGVYSATAGYGLGVMLNTQTAIADCDSVSVTGWFNTDNNTLHCPTGANKNSVLYCVTRGAQYAYQEFYDPFNAKLYRRWKNQASPWEAWYLSDNGSPAFEQQLAYVENGTTASRTYAVGEYFCWHGLLYRVKAAISSGVLFTPGTNCEQVTEGGFNSLRSVTVNPLTIEATSYITNINQCRAYTVGRIAYVFISCQIEATPVALINLIKGIPRPYGNTLLSFSSATSSGTTFVLAVSVENGVAYIRKGSNNATTAGWYTGTISYPIA